MKNKFLLLSAISILGFAANGMTQDLPSYLPADGLIGWWPFNGNANDESGNNNNGTSNGAILATDRFGQADSAYLFDGTSSYIQVPTSASLESPSTALTLSAWVNLAGYSLVGQPYGPIITKSNGSANAFMYRFDIDLNGVGYYAGANDWTNNIGTAYNFQLNQWYLLTAVLDTDIAYLYLNDTLLDAPNFTTNIQNNTLPLEFGRDVPGITEVFNGKLDDIAIWNRVLSPVEIAGLYNGAPLGINKPEVESQLIIYPNPANQQLNVLANENCIGSTYRIIDQFGKIVLTGKLDSRRAIIFLNTLCGGIYLLRIEDKLSQKFEVVRN